MPLVDADDGCTVGRELARDGKERAVAAQDDDNVAPPAQPGFGGDVASAGVFGEDAAVFGAGFIEKYRQFFRM